MIAYTKRLHIFKFGTRVSLSSIREACSYQYRQQEFKVDVIVDNSKIDSFVKQHSGKCHHLAVYVEGNMKTFDLRSFELCLNHMKGRCLRLCPSMREPWSSCTGRR